MEIGFLMQARPDFWPQIENRLWMVLAINKPPHVGGLYPHMHPELTGLPGGLQGAGKVAYLRCMGVPLSGYKNLEVLRDAVELGITPARPAPGWTPGSSLIWA